MRKVLLASTALLLTAGVAMAADSAPVIVSATVPQSCEFTTPPGDIPLSGPAIGNGGSSNFTFECNFGGPGTPLSLGISFQSLNGGVLNPADTSRGYNITYLADTFSAASAQASPHNVPDSSDGANVGSPRSFSVALTENLEVAGTYSDTLTVSVAP